MSNFNSTIVYMDSSSVPTFSNITCCCTVDVNGKVNITVAILEFPDQLEISTDNVTFTNPFLKASTHEFGTGVVVLRYTTYEKRLTSLCLRLEGHFMQVSCQRAKPVQILQTSTASTDRHIGIVTNHTVFPAITSTPLTRSTQTTTGSAKGYQHNGTSFCQHNIIRYVIRASTFNISIVSSV